MKLLHALAISYRRYRLFSTSTGRMKVYKSCVLMVGRILYAIQSILVSMAVLGTQQMVVSLVEAGFIPTTMQSKALTQLDMMAS